MDYISISFTMSLNVYLSLYVPVLCINCQKFIIIASDILNIIVVQQLNAISSPPSTLISRKGVGNTKATLALSFHRSDPIIIRTDESASGTKMMKTKEGYFKGTFVLLFCLFMNMRVEIVYRAHKHKRPFKGCKILFLRILRKETQ
jgi:hypothetical protein